MQFSNAIPSSFHELSAVGLHESTYRPLFDPEVLVARPLEPGIMDIDLKKLLEIHRNMVEIDLFETARRITWSMMVDIMHRRKQELPECDRDTLKITLPCRLSVSLPYRELLKAGINTLNIDISDKRESIFLLSIGTTYDEYHIQVAGMPPISIVNLSRKIRMCQLTNLTMHSAAKLCIRPGMPSSRRFKASPDCRLLILRVKLPEETMIESLQKDVNVQ